MTLRETCTYSGGVIYGLGTDGLVYESRVGLGRWWRYWGPRSPWVGNGHKAPGTPIAVD